MADVAGSLTYRFDADVSGFARAIDSAGAKLDALSQRASAFAAGRPLDITSGLSRATGSTDDQAGRELTRLSQQLALLQSTGAAHAAIAEQIKIEAAQTKLGSDATVAQKASAASLVQQIDAAAVAQAKLRAAQEATNTAWRYGSNTLTSGIEAMIFQGEKLRDVGASLLSSFAKSGLSAALSGSGPLAGLLGTAGTNGAVGGLFGALGSLFTGSTAASTFSGLYADGGTIGAGQWGVVGEKGAEVVAGPATVVPWAKAMGQGGQRSTQVIQFNVTTPDAPSFARSEAQMAALVSRAVARGGRNS
ncbi:phage tail tape measure protein [Lichenifustis flavocetrariae]|uniref:Phage tail tape measure protein n=1 Tax=Lichenifustis flavocetrariae TaxID=2949735 RepID=A0AA41Z113_9HYPH|nr:hypothetical protein [Lichenifustis flavocetrariae]MCW6510987.1 hypothetical protein [Lichenifustis flavocetrariae]